MRLGIAGLPSAGKTTLFNALTGQAVPTGGGGHGKLSVHLATAEVPDSRLQALAAMYKPRKVVHATVTYVDLDYPPPDRPASLPGAVRNELAKTEGLLHVVRLFSAPDVAHPLGSIDPVRDIRALEAEMLLADLLMVETRLEKLRAEWPKRTGAERSANEAEQATLGRFHTQLSAERPLRELEGLAEDDMAAVRGFGLLTLRPQRVLLNADEGVTLPADAADAGAALAFPGLLEAEIGQLDAADRGAFLAEYSLAEPISARIIALSYEMLGIHSFFTVGEDEVRAWSVPVGATAVQAAAVIHTDLARGFIRAETTAFDELMSLGGMPQAKAAGRQRLEGKAYVVRDGDILTIRAGT
jgi:GTP-binding protein YchF